MLGSALDTEVVGGRTRRHDEVVEGHRFLVLDEQVLALPVDAPDGAEVDVDVSGSLEDRPDRVGDVSGVQAAGGDLVEQGQEGVEVVAVDDRHVHLVATEAAGDGQSAEPGADDHDVGARFSVLPVWVGLAHGRPPRHM